MKKGEKLQTLINERYPGLSNRKFAAMAGIPPTTLQGMIENGLEKAAVTNVIKVAKALDLTVADIVPEAAPIQYESSVLDNEFTKDRNSRVHEDSYFIRPTHGTHGIRKPFTTMLGLYNLASEKRSLNVVNFYGEISAGALTAIDPINDCEQVDLPKSCLGKYAEREGIFIMKVNGDSMNKIIPHGSYVVCAPIELYELKNDDIVIYSLNNESSMKRYRKTNEALIFSPESTIKEFYDVVVPLDTSNEVKIHAKVILYAVSLE